MANTPLNIPQLGSRFIDWRQPVRGDSFNWSWNRPLDQVQRIAIHHSVTRQTLNWQEEVAVIADLHVGGRGWGGVGYHFIISSTGVVAYVGDIGTARANIANHNEKIIGICLVGDFTQHLPTDIQINSAHDLCGYLIGGYPALTQITGWDKVMGHKDAVKLFGNTTATACPGSSWPVDMRDRIRDNIIYTPQDDGSRPPIIENPEVPTDENETSPEDGGNEQDPEIPDTDNGIPDPDPGTDVPELPSEPGSNPIPNNPPDSGNGDIPIPPTNPKIPQEPIQFGFIAVLRYLLSKIPIIGILFG